ncbi:hypothetical protein VTN00DRAFT_1703 [Thermoascus crustaceus]|uniref:uncharacterized protein n=1 Tax=Thermoascus crustaceus TaxID=5088 RepID=UPI003741F34C
MFSMVHWFPVDHFESDHASFETSQPWLLRVLSLRLVLRLEPVLGVSAPQRPEGGPGRSMELLSVGQNIFADR